MKKYLVLVSCLFGALQAGSSLSIEKSHTKTLRNAFKLIDGAIGQVEQAESFKGTYKLLFEGVTVERFNGWPIAGVYIQDLDIIASNCRYVSSDLLQKIFDDATKKGGLLLIASKQGISRISQVIIDAALETCRPLERSASLELLEKILVDQQRLIDTEIARAYKIFPQPRIIQPFQKK